MFSHEEYLWGWIYYLAGVLLIVICWWSITSKIPWREVKYVSRLIVISVLAVPWYSDIDQPYLAPAWLMASMELIFDGSAAFWRAGLPLTVGVVVILFISLASYLLYGYLKRQRKAVS